MQRNTHKQVRGDLQTHSETKTLKAGISQLPEQQRNDHCRFRSEFLVNIGCTFLLIFSNSTKIYVFLSGCTFKGVKEQRGSSFDRRLKDPLQYLNHQGDIRHHSNRSKCSQITQPSPDYTAYRFILANLNSYLTTSLIQDQREKEREILTVWGEYNNSKKQSLCITYLA